MNKKQFLVAALTAVFAGLTLQANASQAIMPLWLRDVQASRGSCI